MNRLWIMSCAMCLSASASAWTPREPQAPAAQHWVTLEFVGEHGEVFRTYPTSHGDAASYRAYLEASPQARYSIRARNLTGERVGIVIAVDGRNIISGERSELGRGEPMYILGPHETATYAGWRTSQREIRRFYFTNVEDSYASRIGDESAMGVIAAAVYREQAAQPRISQPESGEAAAAPVPAGESRDSAARSAQAGTGFGEREQSHAIRVAFSPVRRPSQRSFFKYEWSEQLCARGVKTCGPVNRFWPESRQGFVPLPPGEPG